MLEVIRVREKVLFTVAETESVDEGWFMVLGDIIASRVRAELKGATYLG